MTITHVLASVVLCFFISLAPFHTQRLLYVLQDYRLINELNILWKSLFILIRLNWVSDEIYYAINEKLFYITGIFFYLNATINPIIYNVMSAKYRKAFLATFIHRNNTVTRHRKLLGTMGTLVSRSREPSSMSRTSRSTVRMNNDIEMSLVRNFQTSSL